MLNFGTLVNLGAPPDFPNRLGPNQQDLYSYSQGTMVVKNFYAVQAGRVPGIYDNWA